MLRVSRLLCVVLAVTAFSARGQPRELVIVELRVAAELSTQQAKTAALATFRRDLDAIADSASIRREYSVVFHGAALQIEPAMLPAIAALPYVEDIHPDGKVDALALRTRSRHMPATHASMSSRGEGVTVAVLDSGIDYTHPALGSGFGPGFKVAGGYDFVNGDADPHDDNGHGTHVAGIIAAESDEMTGIAPRSTLVAYKVLDAVGSGRQSDVIAALERVVDPNGDGDASDHLDVANLSLGGVGTPDDPQSKAVDAAVAAGVIVCVAAGNDGDSFAIRSPGTARSAITVGAVGDDFQVAPFSSRGPSVKLVTIKPDVLAPGVKVRSTFRGGAYAVMDGTSMATAHVAGACALLRAIHREWTPLEMKTAITMNAVPLELDAMEQGAGLIDVASAAATPLLASESHFSFGLDAQQTGIWERSHSISITNVDVVPGTYNVIATTSDPAISVRVTPSLLRLAAGDSAVITLTVRIDHDFVTAESCSGTVTLTSTEDSVHFAWAAVTSSRARLSMEPSCAAFYLLSFHAPRQPRWISANAAEAYVPAGRYELVAIGHDAGENGPANVMLIASEVTIAGDVAIQFTHEDAPHTIALRGVDERGTPLGMRTNGERYVSRFHVHLPAYRRFQSFEILPGDGRISTSSLPSGFELKAAEISVDAATNRIVALQHRGLTEVTEDVTLSCAADQHQRIRLVYAHGPARREVTVSSVAIDTEPLSSVIVASFDTFESSWTGDLLLNQEFGDAHVMSVALQAGEPGRPADLVTPALRVRNGRFIASNAPEPSPLAYVTVGDVVTFGDGPAFVVPHVIASKSSLHTCMKVFGAAGECLPRAVAEGLLTVYDEGGQVIAEHHGDSIDMPLSPSGAGQIEFATRALSTAQQPMRATLSTNAASTAAITSIAIVDAAGTMTPALERYESGALLFTAASPLRTEETRAWFRRAGTSEWLPLIPILVNDDTTSAETPLGLQFIADLATATTRGGMIDLRISVADVSGNATILTLEPAFTVSAGRSRAVAHR